MPERRRSTAIVLARTALRCAFDGALRTIQGRAIRFQAVSLSFRSSVAESPPLPRLYSIANVSASFHRAEASLQDRSGDHANSLTIASLLTRHTAISWVQRAPHTSAVTNRWRSGESRGSVGSSKRRLLVRSTNVKLVLSP